MFSALSEKVGEQGGVIVKQKEEIAWLRASMAILRSLVAEHGKVILFLFFITLKLRVA